MAGIACAGVLHIGSLLAQEVPPSYPVRGVVLNSVTRQPIARVLVDGREDAVLTNSEGHFELKLSEGTTQISIRRPGYNSTGFGAQHLVKVGANAPDLTFYLSPEAAISVHVSLSSGDEIDGIRFVEYRRQVFNGRGSWVPQGTFNTDSEGNLHLVNLDAPSSYMVCSMAFQEATGVAPDKATYGYSSGCLPDGSEPAGASPVSLAAGQQAQFEFTLARQRFYPVSIAMPSRVEAQAGVGIQIHDQSGRPTGLPAHWNQEHQAFEARLPSGSYYAEANVGGKAPSYGRLDFHVSDGPVSGLSITVSPLKPVSVQIRRDFTESDNSQQGLVLISGSSDPGPGVNLNLVSADSLTGGVGGSGLRRVEGSRDSTLFEMDNVKPGRYWVQANAFQGYVSSIASGGVDLARDPLVIGPGNSTTPIEITLRNDAGSISGTINQSPATGPGANGSAPGEMGAVFLYTIPLFSSAAQITETRTGDAGRFGVGNLAPGSYLVVAFDEPQEIEMGEPQALARFAGKGQTVSVSAGGTASVQLDLIQTAGEEPAP
jgi:hypothetical protein